jgi:hypothetical protein
MEFNLVGLTSELTSEVAEKDAARRWAITGEPADIPLGKRLANV